MLRFIIKHALITATYFILLKAQIALFGQNENEKLVLVRSPPSGLDD